LDAWVYEGTHQFVWVLIATTLLGARSPPPGPSLPSARRDKLLFYFLFGKSSPTVHFTQSSFLLFGELELRDLARSRMITDPSNSRDPMARSSPVPSGLPLYHSLTLLHLRYARHLQHSSSNSRVPMFRDIDNSRSRYSHDQMTPTSTPDVRGAETPIPRVTCHVTLYGPHGPRDCWGFAPRPLATSVAKSSASFSRTSDMPIHESSYTPCDFD